MTPFYVLGSTVPRLEPLQVGTLRHSLTAPPPPPLFSGEGGAPPPHLSAGKVEPPTNFSKGGGGELDRNSIFRGVARKEGVTFFIGLKFLHNNQFSEIFNDKESLFLSVITKNLNWEILTKNLVTFRRWGVVKDGKLLYYVDWGELP